MNMLTGCMAAELGSVGIRTATVALGYIRTPDIAQLVKSGRIDSVADHGVSRWADGTARRRR